MELNYRSVLFVYFFKAIVKATVHCGAQFFYVKKKNRVKFFFVFSTLLYNKPFISA